MKSGKKPNDIPTAPHSIYKNEGWISYGDWFGTGTIAAQNIIFRDFKTARDFVRKQGFINQNDWRDFIKSGDKPKDIPSSPSNTYKEDGWISFGDWLGTERIATQKIVYIDISEAKKIIHRLNLKSKSDWVEYCKSGKKPNDIPSTPNIVYRNKGWAGWGDWLGTGRVAPQNMSYKSFNEVKEFVHALKFKKLCEQKAFCKSGKKSDNIPNAPEIVYKEWNGAADFLGNNKLNRNEDFLSYEDAKKIIHTLKLKSIKEWNIYSKKNRPKFIPNNPCAIYKNKGWKDWGDFLGTGNVSNRNKTFLSYRKVKMIVSKLGIKNQSELPSALHHVH